MTIEGISSNKKGELHPLQQAFVEHFCGSMRVLYSWNDYDC